jgi:hypothetical protein
MGSSNRAQRPDGLPVKKTFSEISLFLLKNSEKITGEVS